MRKLITFAAALWFLASAITMFSVVGAAALGMFRHNPGMAVVAVALLFVSAIVAENVATDPSHWSQREEA
jgi:membrane protein YdbS with pleckstrin-like domain